MGEIPHFISGIPEKTIPQQKIDNIPIRSFDIFQGEIELTSPSEDVSVILFTIPDDSVFEITYAAISCITTGNPPPGDMVNFGITTTQQSRQFLDPLIFLMLDHNEHGFISINPSPESLLIKDNRVTAQIVSTDNALGGFMRYVLMGNIIKKSELSLKRNLLL